MFLKTPSTDDEAIFIRCTEAPIDQIARQIFQFVTEPFVLKTPRGTRKLDLTPALAGFNEWEPYLNAVRNHEIILHSLQQIAEIIPQTLVLIIDQAEEVLTLNPSEENFENRSRSFAFLREFQKLEFDARILVTLRTEYFGRFVDATQVSHRIAAEFQQFYLAELSRPALIDAILRPTRKDKVGSFGIPFMHYGFVFDDGLPDLIVDDILKARYSGPALPILQLVCLVLYEECKRHGRALIDKTEYSAQGRVDGLMIQHIRKAIRDIYSDEDKFREDIESLRSFLNVFYIMQDDGTVVSRTVEATWVLADLSKRGLIVSPEKLLGSSTSPQTLILRMLRNVKANGKVSDEITLGHNSVALALERWKAEDVEARIHDIEIRSAIRIEKVEVDYKSFLDGLRATVGCD